ncbi:ABC transporter ATP-binding protein [Metabacillus sp. GX 13764]|uniref:ABC transporter ATP-binding protein n=1 Tax=Metabacillus kandeliae TaxID=2900151 RepID=UPI001E64204C|nr:ABC transporter ATP-binding protein [Metabacillus kandeliae]MCD7032669.1 ABC transporter ATP-binding protein [Metabacillus kandeliae]
MLEVKNITKKLDNELVLDSVSFTLNQGEIFGLLGRNGSGKTTLLRIIQQILLPDEGDVLFENVSIHMHPLVKRKIFYMPVQNLYYERFSYMDLVKLYKRIYPDFDEEYAGKLMDRYSLSKTKKYRELSTGLKKQLSLVMAFASRPAVILLDEPTDGVDAVTRHDLLELMIREVADRNTAILITSHRLEDLERICSRIGFLEDSRLTGMTELDDLKGDFTKIQFAIEENVLSLLEERNIPVLSQTGVFYTILLPKNDVKSRNWLKNLHPNIWNEMPISLEEVFIAKFGGKRQWQEQD